MHDGWPEQQLRGKRCVSSAGFLQRWLCAGHWRHRLCGKGTPGEASSLLPRHFLHICAHPSQTWPRSRVSLPRTSQELGMYRYTTKCKLKPSFTYSVLHNLAHSFQTQGQSRVKFLRYLSYIIILIYFVCIWLFKKDKVLSPQARFIIRYWNSILLSICERGSSQMCTATKPALFPFSDTDSMLYIRLWVHVEMLV